jgi:hypothetical protein
MNIKKISGYSDINSWEDYQLAKVSYFQSMKGRVKWFEWLIDSYNQGKLNSEKKDLLNLIIVDKLSEPTMAPGRKKIGNFTITKKSMDELFESVK